MIDTFTENVIHIDDATEHFSKICGRKRNRHVILRWMNRGCSGVVLESIRIGREIYTSAEAINRFTNRLAEVKREMHGQATKEGIARKRRADTELDAQANELGI